MQQGLSQQQLAGKELSRSLICRLEKGDCKPSIDTLRIIARRLGKPLEYFVADDDVTEETDTLSQLLVAVTRAVAMRSGDAVELARKAVRFSRRLGRPDLEGRALRHLGQTYFAAGRYDQCVEVFEECAEAYRNANLKAPMVEAWFEAGRSAQFAEEFPSARRYYVRVLRMTEQLKGQSELRARTLINLGTCYLRMGDTDEALSAYEEALLLCKTHGLDLQFQAQALMGLGLGKRQVKDLPAAYDAIAEGMQIFIRLQHPALINAKHNLAVVLADMNKWAAALELFHECANYFAQRKDIEQEAAVHEELAWYYLNYKQLIQSELEAEKSLALLNKRDHGITRGRVYRLLGRIALVRGDRARATELFRMSIDLLSRVKAVGEVEETKRQLQEALGGESLTHPGA